MKIGTKVITFRPIASKAEKFGLKPFVMDRLGPIVAVTGPNGSGKSRLLQLLREHLAELGSQRFTNFNRLAEQRSRLIAEAGRLSTRPDHDSREVLQQLEAVKRRIREDDKYTKLYEATRLDPESAESIATVNFVPKNLTLKDSNDLTPTALRQSHASATSIGVDRLADYCLPYIQLSQNRWKEVTHQDFEDSDGNGKSLIASYQELLELVQRLLSTKLGRTSDGEATLFGRPLGKAELSDGQKVLLQLAVALHAQKSSGGHILLVDEPENHLHPAALVQALDGITTSLPGIQIWIATHSVPLLAHLHHLDPNCIWYVKDGEVAYAAKKTLQVLEGLLGQDAQRANLVQFLDLPSQLAASIFAAQCLVPPTVAADGSKDPQVNQVAECISNLAQDTVIRLLDIGAGKGRLLNGLQDSMSGITKRLEYIAIDAEDKDRSECEAQIASVYGASDRCWFNSQEDLFGKKDQHSFQIAVMCNVLHEIEPDRWLDLFGSSGILQCSLCDEGYLLLVEDMRIPIGELPNQRGFFLLDTAHLKALFAVSERDQADKLFIRHDARGDGRLLAHLISAKLLKRVTGETRKNAIRELLNSSKRMVRDLRSDSGPTYENGHKYGLWSQQLANCTLWLEDN